MTEKHDTSQRETWREWLSPDAALAVLGPQADPRLLITRGQLLEHFHGAVTERELRYWESLGALPRPVRRFHNGAIHALYPAWYVDVVGNVHLRRAEKLPPAEIRSYVRDLFDGFAAHLTGWQPRTGPSLPHGLVEEVERFARQMHQKYGITAHDATLSFRTKQGRRLSWHFPFFGGATTLGYSTFNDKEPESDFVIHSSDTNENETMLDTH